MKLTWRAGPLLPPTVLGRLWNSRPNRESEVFDGLCWLIRWQICWGKLWFSHIQPSKFGVSVHLSYQLDALGSQRKQHIAGCCQHSPLGTLRISHLRSGAEYEHRVTRLVSDFGLGGWAEGSSAIDIVVGSALVVQPKWEGNCWILWL